MFSVICYVYTRIGAFLKDEHWVYPQHMGGFQHLLK